MKNVLILGAGISGLGAARVLSTHGANVVVSDLADQLGHKKEEFINAGVQFCFGPQGDVLLDGMDTVVVSPAIPAENPVVRGAVKRGIPVISEVELGYRITKAPILGVTGTNGKTTTTTLLGKMIKKAGIPCVVAGNIGASLSLEVSKVPANGLIAAELSSFQLEFIDTFKPKAAVILNITPDHMERHHTMEAYVDAKARIFENMDQDGALLLNENDPYTPDLAARARSHTHVYMLNTDREVEEGACIIGDMLTIKSGGKTIPLVTTGELQLKGKQNYEDCLAAAFLAYIGGVPVEAIRDVLKEFTGLEHRIEFVRKLHGVSYVNDSKATNVDAALKGINAFTAPIILIAGGHDKETPIEGFMKYVKEHTRHLVLLGEAANRFYDTAVKVGITSLEKADSMEDAVKRAQKAAHEGDVVLLSPACSSFDMFSSYEERGEVFKNIVNHLK